MILAQENRESKRKGCALFARRQPTAFVSRLRAITATRATLGVPPRGMATLFSRKLQDEIQTALGELSELLATRATQAACITKSSPIKCAAFRIMQIKCTRSYSFPFPLRLTCRSQRARQETGQKRISISRDVNERIFITGSVHARSDEIRLSAVITMTFHLTRMSFGDFRNPLEHAARKRNEPSA